MKYYSNFKRYDGKGRRISIFGIEKKDKLQVYIITCAKKDHFNKQLAHNAFNKIIKGEVGIINGKEVCPLVVYISLADNSALHQFHAFCKSFYKLKPQTVRLNADYLVDNKGGRVKRMSKFTTNNKWENII